SQKGDKELITTLKQHGISYELHLDECRMRQLTEVAEVLFEEWCDTLLQKPKTVKRLPDCIRRLESFIALNIPVTNVLLTRVLRTCLELYNEWCQDLIVIGDDDAELLPWLQSARIVADKLVPF